MSNAITEPGGSYDFGLEFNYALWTAGTVVTLVNVPWNNDYRDIVRFASRTELNAYINSRSGAGITINGMSYVKPNMPIRINIPFNRAYKFNYLRASNPIQPVPGGDIQKDFYYFITDVNYISPNTTELTVQLDVWQTFGYDIQFGNCYVERGHIGIANANNFSGYGRDYLTIPEGFDLGSEYQTIATRNHWIMTPTPWGVEANDLPGGVPGRYQGYDILVVSTVDLTADPGTDEAPLLVSASGGALDGTTHGATLYVFDAQQFGSFMSAFAEKPWVTQGIISVTMIPKINRYHPGFAYSEEVAMGVETPALFPRTINHTMQVNWRNNSEIVGNLPSRYSHLKKFFTYPYMAIEMTTFHGTPLVLKPEAWNNPNAEVMERATMVPPGQRVEFMPRWYNSKISTSDDLDEPLWPNVEGYDEQFGDDMGEYLDLVTMVANFPTMALVNNGALGYLASNVHGIAYQRSSADWTQQRALGSNRQQYDVSSRAIETARDLTSMAQIADQGQTAIANAAQANQGSVGMIGAVGQGATSGALFGGKGAAGGAMVGGVNAIVQGKQTQIQLEANTAAQQMRNLTMGANNAIETRQNTRNRDTNKIVADWAARGDYANSIAGVNARVQDAALIQPTTSGQMGGETINMSNGGLMVSARWKMVDQSAITRVGEYWLRYGYAIRKFIQPPQSMMVMTKFTYWQLSETYLSTAPMPEGFKQAIRGIFEKGVTVWANPADIGNIDIADNAALPGISY